MAEQLLDSAIHINEIRSLIGHKFGPTRPTVLDQERINLFADATGDYQWIHTDPARAADTETGSTIAHGFLVLALAATVNQELVRIEGTSSRVNYGLNKVRFISPAPAGTRARGYTTLKSVKSVPSGTQLVFDIEIRGDQIEKPLCVAEFISLAPGIHLEQESTA